MTKTDLARVLGVDLRSVSGFENGEYPPSKEKIEKLVQELGFPEKFYFGEDLDVPDPVAVSFRSLSKMTAAQRDMALGEGALALLLSRWLEKEFCLPTATLPDLSREPNPEAAAIALRQLWGRGEQPIPNMVHLLESQGVRVFSLSIDAREVDAFSMWKESTPLIFLNTMKSAEHSRFDAAHELGHLVLHRHALDKGKDTEAAANRFASAFLMPRADVIAHAPSFPTLAGLTKLKKRWIVSLAALVYRLHELGVLNDWQNRVLCRELAKKGYRTKEPEPAPREASLVLQKVFGKLKADGVGRSDIVEMLGLPEDELDCLTFGLTLTSLKGGGIASSTTSRRPELKLVPKD
jgi:Zn-dependent peptidase ImmA (M78 family)/transcriptional regulator with XRE-family HTH domain